MPNLVGIGNTQVPTNAMLGGLAYEDCSVLEKVRSGRKNIIINGAMDICQRFDVNSANNISNATHTYHVDRFKAYESTDGILQGEWIDTDAPPNFTHSVLYHPATTDTSISNDQFAFISQVIELKNMRHLGYGGSYAKTCTLSFYVKSNLTGTFCIALVNDGTNNRQFVTEYTINSANTWEKKTITIPGDTGGTWNSNGLRIAWTLTSAGNRQTTTVGSWFDDGTARYATNKQVSGFMSNTGNTFKLSGVQFEIGNYATDFEYRSYGEELSLCQRYFTFVPSGTVFAGRGNNNDRYIFSYNIPVPMLKLPVIGKTNSLTHGNFSMRRYRDSDAISDSTNTPSHTSSGVYFNANIAMISFDQDGFTGVDDRSATLFLSGGAITLDADI